jgi:AraC family transcriptional activator of tynA and feaB
VIRTWSTLSATPTRQFAHWRELICEAFLDLTPESDLRDGFTGIVKQVPLGPLNLARIDSQRQHVHRTARDIARAARGGYYANLQVRGVSRMSQGGRVTLLRPGDIAVVDTTAEFTFDFPEDFRQLSFFVPASLLEPEAAGAVRTATRIDTGTGVGAAVRHALQALMSSRLAPESATRLATHTAGLLAIALDSSVGAAEEVRSPRSYAAALADIEEHLADEDLSPAATAHRLGVSVRWLHALFAGHDRTYAATVRRLRLEQVWRHLQDPARDQLRIIDLAADAGFGSVASFHRMFRREFGSSPAQIRAASRRDELSTVEEMAGYPG